MSPAPLPRWFGVVGLTVINLLPLWLVLRGDLETPQLLMAYVIETTILMVLSIPAVPSFHAWLRRHQPHDPFKAVAGVVGLVIVVVFTTATVGAKVSRAITWDARSTLSVLAVTASILVGLWWTWRRQGRLRTPVGAFLWRYLLLMTGWVGLVTAETYTRLLDSGWEPTDLDSGWFYDLGRSTTELGIALGVSAAVVPALMLVTLRTVNEVLYEVLDILMERARRRSPAAEPSERPAGSARRSR